MCISNSVTLKNYDLAEGINAFSVYGVRKRVNPFTLIVVNLPFIFILLILTMVTKFWLTTIIPTVHFGGRIVLQKAKRP